MRLFMLLALSLISVSAHAEFEKSAEVKKIEAFVREKLINRTLVCPLKDFKINKLKLLNRVSQRITYKGFASTERGFEFTSTNEVKSHLFNLDADGKPVEPGKKADQVQVRTYHVAESQALKGTLIGSSINSIAKHNVGNVRFESRDVGIVVHTATALFDDLFDTENGWRAGVTTQEEEFSLVDGKLQLLGKVEGFDADAAGIVGAATWGLKLTPSDIELKYTCTQE